MKQFLLFACSFIMLVAPNVYAQKTDGDNLGEITFEELKDKEKTSQYFAVGGGFNGSFLMLNKDDINAHIPATFHVKDFGSQLFVTGGQGFVTFFFKNIRFGFAAGIGTQTVSDTGGTVNGKSITRHADLSSSLNGLTIDYAIPVFKGFTILPGVQGGFGNFVLERYDGPANDEWTNISGSTVQNMSRLETSQWYVQPNLNLEYAVTTFTMLRLNVGYNLSGTSSTWTLNRTTTINSSQSINSTGMVAGFGVFFGLFRNE